VNLARSEELSVCTPFPNFNKENQNWEIYLQQLTQHFSAYSVQAADRKKAYFLSWAGTHIFELVKNLFGSENLDQQTYEQITEMIRDQIIVHTPFDAIRTAALQKLQPSLEDVLSIAESYEATTKTVAVIKESEKRALDTNAVYTQKSNHQKRNFSDGKGGKAALKSCSGCGHSHSHENCKFREAICHKCARKGHIAVVCLSKQCKDKKDTD